MQTMSCIIAKHRGERGAFILAHPAGASAGVPRFDALHLDANVFPQRRADRGCDVALAERRRAGKLVGGARDAL